MSASAKKVQVLYLGNGEWGLFVNGELVKVFDNRGQAEGWACDPNL
jgi:hypothetical protein